MTTANKSIASNRLFEDETILASGVAYSIPISLDLLKTEGFFSIDRTITGSGTAKIEYMLTNKKLDPQLSDFKVPSTASDIETAATSGTDMVEYDHRTAMWVIIRITETGGANSVVMTLDWATQ